MFSKIIVSLVMFAALLSFAPTVNAGTSGPGDRELQCGGATGKPETCMQPLLPETGGDNPYVAFDSRRGSGNMDLGYLSDEDSGIPLFIMLGIGAICLIYILRKISKSR